MIFLVINITKNNILNRIFNNQFLRVKKRNRDFKISRKDNLKCLKLSNLDGVFNIL